MHRFIQIAFLVLILSSYKDNVLYAQPPNDYFQIKVVDKETHRGVPLVELKTVNSIRYYTDNNGIIAFYEPGLMDQEVYFSIRSHGYEFPKDGFGNRGKTLRITKGDSALIEIKRINIAERMYRITGQGLYNYSELLGYPLPIDNPQLNGKVMGQDGGLAIPYNHKLYWFWGDTDRPAYPLGNFGGNGATSELPGNGGLNPDVGIELNYFTNESGFCKEMFPSNEFPGSGMKWPSSLMTLMNHENKESLIAQYRYMKSLDETLERGLGIFNDSTEHFEKLVQFDLNAPVLPDGQTFQVTIDGEKYFYFANLYPNSCFIRVKAKLANIENPETYEGFTCLVSGSSFNKSTPEVDRDLDGKLIYSWKANTSPVGPGLEDKFIKDGLMKPGEKWFNLQDINSGSHLVPYSGSVQWNSYINRWVMIVQQNVGEIWFAEADTPVGPWIYAQKVVEHQSYTFYLPTQHPYFNQDDGRYIYFEGTYTNSFSGNPDRTPRYNYNQIMYRLDLEDPRLYLPEPVYSILDSEGHCTYLMRDAIDSLNLWKSIHEIPFCAYPKNRKSDKLIPVYIDMKSLNNRLLTKLEGTIGEFEKILFYAIPLSVTEQEETIGIWECEAAGFPVNMKIIRAGKDMKVFFEDETLTATKVDFYNDTLTIQTRDTYENSDYIIKTSLSEGIMNGSVSKIGTDETTPFTGKFISLEEKSPVTPVMAPLYEYQNMAGEYYYSTNSEMRGMKRTAEPICYVWKNPSSTVALDYDAKPVPVIK